MRSDLSLSFPNINSSFSTINPFVCTEQSIIPFHYILISSVLLKNIFSYQTDCSLKADHFALNMIICSS